MAAKKVPAKKAAVEGEGASVTSITPSTANTLRAKLAADLLVDAERLRRQLFEPTTERRPMTVSDGAAGSHVEIVDVELDEPSFSSKRTILQSIAVAVDKAVELDIESIDAKVEGGTVVKLLADRAARRIAAAGPVPPSG